MRLVFLGGAHEVGASCLWCDLGGARVLVDAGIRLGAGEDPLPDLGRLAELGGVDAVVLTHAHLDHAGALPLVSQAYPAAPVYCTPATYAVLRVMLGDALRVMEARLEQEGEVPLYPPAAIEALLERVHPLPWGVRAGGAGYAVQLFPAGHVLGAAGVVLDGSAGRLVVSGDVSGEGQRTVGGCLLPPLEPRPDALVLEATYGGALHPNRRAEEERLAQAVAEVVLGGGKALVPAFALGRGQEVIFALRALQEERLIPRFPIWVDGLVGAVCSLYAGYADVGSRELRRRARWGDPFFDRSGWVTPVRRLQREKVLTAGPGAIVASSGMLTGGPSAYYAARLAGDARHAILLTGYQDEESPGRRLLQLAGEPASGEGRSLMLGGQEVQVAARVGKYGLSAHADGSRLAALAAAVGARQVVLCHGEPAARRALAELIRDREVLLPANGEMLTLVSTLASASRPALPAAGEPDEPAAAPDIPALRARLLAAGAARHYALRELAQLVWGRTTPQLEAELASVLAGSPLFQRDAQRPYLYRLAASVPPGGEPGAPPAEGFDGRAEAPAGGRLEQNEALVAVERALPAGSGLYRKGAYPAEGRLLLYFHFPAVARERHAERLAELGRETGWQIEVQPAVHQGELVAAARRALGPEVQLQREPAVHLEASAVRVRLRPGSPEPPAPALAAFREETGFDLVVEPPASAPVSSAVPTAGVWEQNYLLAEVERRFAGRPHRVYRKGIKVDGVGRYLEVSFITPEVGSRYAAELASLAEVSGWRVRVGSQPNQQALLEAVSEVLPEGWRLARPPGVHLGQRLVTLALAEVVDDAALADPAARYLELTGWRLIRDH